MLQKHTVDSKVWQKFSSRFADGFQLFEHSRVGEWSFWVNSESAENHRIVAHVDQRLGDVNALWVA